MTAPLRVGRWHLAAEAVLVAAVVLLASVVQCHGTRQGAADATAARLAENTHKATLALLAERRTADSLTRVALAYHGRVIEQGQVLRRMSRAADALLAANDSLLSHAADTGAVIHQTELLARLAATTTAFRTYRDSTDMLLASVDALVARHADERAAFHAERAANDAVIAAQAAEIRHWERRSTCRVGPIPCPTRTQTATLGFLVALLVL